MNARSSSTWLSREFIWEPQAVQAMVWLTLLPWAWLAAVLVVGGDGV